MAKVRNNPVVRGISGSVGSLVFRQMPDGSTYISGKHDFSRRKFSDKQKAHQERFRAAVTYARDASRSKSVYAQLAAGTIFSPYNFALQDWFNPPVIHCVERQGMTVRVQASDDVCVAGVAIVVLDENGEVREKGEGVRGEGDWWECVIGREGKVMVQVRDLAGNVVRGEISE